MVYVALETSYRIYIYMYRIVLGSPAIDHTQGIYSQSTNRTLREEGKMNYTSDTCALNPPHDDLFIIERERERELTRLYSEKEEDMR